MSTDLPHPADRSRWLALYVLCGSMLMIVLDATIVNVALPSIKAELHFDPSSLAWVVNAYLIAFGGLLLLAGRLGDLAGRRRIFVIGLAVFTIASAACGLAVNQEMLVIARFVQGAGGALTSAVVLGMIVTMFPEPREQARAIGVFAFVASAGGAVGLLAGGVITEAVSWHWIFFVNVPVGVVVALAALRLVPSDKGLGFGEGADVLGAALVTAALMLGVYTIVKPAAEHGWLAGSDADSRRGQCRTADRLRRAAGAHCQPADAAGSVPLAQPRWRERDPGDRRRRHVRRVLPRHPLPAERQALRRAADRPGVPAGDDLHGHPVRAVLGED